MIFFIFVSLFLSLSAGKLYAEDKSLATELASLLRQSLVLVLGETHHKPESPCLVADVVTAYLDAGVQGEKHLSEIVIHPIIDHPAYRDMLGRLRDLRQAGKCFKVHAVDTPEDHLGPRDAWMAEEIRKLGSSGPVLVLVGNLHALKRIRWESGKDEPDMAERLTRLGVQVRSVLQEWETGCDKRNGRLLEIRQPRAVVALRSIMSPVAAHSYETPEEATDYVVVWECNEKGR